MRAFHTICLKRLRRFLRRTWVRGLVLGLCPFLLVGLASAQQDFSKVQIKVTKVAGTVYMLEGAGGNIGVSVGEDGIVIVDDQFAPLATRIKEALKGITDKPLKFVLNTHFHGDHTGGNAEFSNDATIIAHENVRKRLGQGTTVLGGEVNRLRRKPCQSLPLTIGPPCILTAKTSGPFIFPM